MFNCFYASHNVLQEFLINYILRNSEYTIIIIDIKSTIFIVIIMTIIDFHVHPPLDAEEKHINPEKIAEDIIEWMNSEGIDVTVILPIAPYISNEYVSKIVDYNPKRLIGFASVVPNPADFAIKKLKYAIQELGLKGLKLHPGMQGFSLRNTHVLRVIRFAGELQIPVIIHTMFGDFSTLYFKTTPSFDENRIEDYALLPFIAPETTIILAHMSGSFHFEDVLQIATSSNVYVDTSYSLITIVRKIGLELLAEYVKALGSEKFIFGSDYVLGLTPEEYGAKKQIELIRKMSISDENKKNILYRNAAKILGLLDY